MNKPEGGENSNADSFLAASDALEGGGVLQIRRPETAAGGESVLVRRLLRLLFRTGEPF